MAEKATSTADTSLLRETMRLYIGEQRRLLHDEGVPPQGRLLVMLLRRGVVTQAEFGRLLGLEKSWVSRSVDKLVAQGWVERSVLPEDKRSMQLSLTPAGRAAAKKVDARMNAHADSVLERVPGPARQRVMNALRELNAALQKPVAGNSGDTK